MHSLIHSLARSLTRTFIIHQLDAINVHPFEFVVGEYLHLLTIYLVPCHVCTAVFFVLAGGVFASLNHTRFDIDLPGGIYSVKNHDVHHRDVQKNFGQYIMLWDHALGSYLSYDAKPHRQEVVAPVKGMTTAELLAKTKAKLSSACGLLSHLLIDGCSASNVGIFLPLAPSRSLTMASVGSPAVWCVKQR